MLSVIKALPVSFTRFPSCIFWITACSPYVAYVATVSLLIIKTDTFNSYVPTPSSLLDSSERCTFIIIELVGVLTFIRIHFIIQRYYKYVLLKAAKAAKTQIMKLLKIETIVSLIIVMSNLIFLFAKPSKHPFLHYGGFVIFYASNNALNMIITRLNRINVGELYPNGYILDVINAIILVVGMPFYLNQLKDCDMYSQNYTISTAVPNALFLFTSLKYVYIAMNILGDRFIKISDSVC